MGSCLSKKEGVQEPDKPVGEPNRAAVDKAAAADPPDAAAAAAAAPTAAAATASAYCGAPAPLCELARLRHLADLDILYTQPERRFDDITKLCAMVFKVPIALVSLVDQDVQWFKSARGVDVDRTPRPTSFCAWTLLPTHPEALVVQDAILDARFRNNPLVVGPPHIRFYAGCPLVSSNGLRLGSLCIIDKAPRTFEAESCNMLANMAEMVVREIEKDKALEQHRLRQQKQREQQKQERRQLLRAINCFSEAIMLVDTAAAGGWEVVFANEAWQSQISCPLSPEEPLKFWSLFRAPAANGNSSADLCSRYAEAVEAQQDFEILVTYSPPAGAEPPQQGACCPPGAFVLARFRCAGNARLGPDIGIPAFLPSASEGEEQPYYFVTTHRVPPLTSDGSAQHSTSTSFAGSALQQVPSSSAASTTHNSAGAGVGVGSGRRLEGGAEGRRLRPPSRLSSFSVVQGNEPFADVRLGPILGKGAFGRVYRGMWCGKLVAVKVIEYSAELNSDGQLLEGLLSEQVEHPNVVRTYKHMTRPLASRGDDFLFAAEDDGVAPSDCGSTVSSLRSGPGTGTGGTGGGGGGASPLMEAWLVLEFCDRGCVVDAVEKGWFRLGAPTTAAEPGDGGLSIAPPTEADIAAVVATAREIAGAMAYLHSRNMLHGDLTGNNVLLSVASTRRGYSAKVSDFGLSRLISSDAPVIETRTCGTVTHMAPELLAEGKLSKAADVYSFGVILWEMVSQRRAYAGLTHTQVLHRVSNGERLAIPSNAPQPLAELLRSCLAPDLAARPTFGQVLALLTELADGDDLL